MEETDSLVEDQQNKEVLTWKSGVTQIFHAAVGAGVIGLSEAPSVLGWPLSLFLLWGFGILSSFTSIYLGSQEKNSLREAVYEHGGNPASYIATFVTSTNAFSTNIMNIVLIGQLLKPYNNVLPDIWFRIIAGIIAGSWAIRYTEMKKFRLAGIIGVISTIVLVGGMLTTPIGHDCVGHPPAISMFAAFTNIALSMQHHATSSTIGGSLKNKKQFMIAEFVAMSGVLLTYTIVMIVGALCIGAGEFGNPLVSITGPLYIVIVICVVLMEISAFPIVATAGRNNILDSLKLSHDSKWRYIIAVGWPSLAVIIAVVIPKFEVVASAMGFLASFNMFTLPGMSLLGEGNTYSSWKKRIFGLILILIGLSVSGVALVSAIIAFKSNK